MMRYRILSYIGVVIGALFFPIWIFIPLALLYALIFSPYELLPLAVLIDAGYGDVNRGYWYLYTLSVSVILISAQFIRPYLRFYS